MKKLSFFVLALIVFFSCEEENTGVTYDNTPYDFNYADFPPPTLPLDNPLTVQGVELGRMLFYEPKLSRDNSLACAGCHLQQDGFSDIRQFSIGVESLPGKRQAMASFNMAWHQAGFFWDGRSATLRDQALKPIQDPLEMNETLENAVSKVEAEQMYRDQFIRAFGDEEVTAERISLAIEQFMLSVVSADSPYDKYRRGEQSLSDSELRGMELFFAEYNPFFPDESGADCAHCHSGLNFENGLFMNNGLDSDAEFVDEGRFAVTEDPMDMAKFKVPSLRNIDITPPYMHDGRFATLEEVLDHYNEGIKISSTVDPAILNTMSTGLLLSDQDKADLIAFMRTLTDTEFLNNEAYSDPF